MFTAAQRELMDGAEYLRRFVEKRGRHNAIAGRPDLSAMDMVEVRGLVNGLVAAGAVSDAVARSMLAEAFANTIGQRRNETRMRPEGIRDEESSHPVPGPPTLVRVIPVAAPGAQTEDVYAISTDIWSASVSVRFGFPPSIDSGHVSSGERRCTAIDDVGVTYKEFSRANTDAGGLVISTRFLRPAPSDEAKTLAVSLDDNTTVVVPLQFAPDAKAQE